MQFAVKSISRHLIGVALLVISAFASAEWTKIENGNALESEKYVDLDSVKQSGPMAIHRQVQVLSQGGELLAKGIGSELSLYEYDCMNSKFRVLETTAFAANWAAGGKVLLQTPPPNNKDWQNLPLRPLGQIAMNLVCPGAGTN